MGKAEAELRLSMARRILAVKQRTLDRYLTAQEDVSPAALDEMEVKLLKARLKVELLELHLSRTAK